MAPRCGQLRWSLVAAAVLAAAVLVAGCVPTPGARSSRASGPANSGPLPRVPAASSGASGQPSRFISLRLEPRRLRTIDPASYLEVAVSDSQAGTIVRRLLPASRDGMRVTGLALDRPGNLWITYSRGPVSRGDTLGGDPRPDSCGNMIAILHAATGRVTTFLRTSDSVLISGAAPSPDGRLLAYGESGCAAGYLNSYLRVTDLATRRSWTIGQGLARCHLITDPSWSTDGRALIVGYAPAAKPAYSGPQGTCLQPRRERLVSLTPGAAQPGLAGAAAEADPGCQITSAAGTAGGGILAIEACGREGYMQGRARLLVFGPRLGLARRITLGRCTDGNELSPDLSGQSVLVSAYLYCNPPGRPGPVTRLWTYTAGTLRLITSVPGDSMGVSLMTW